jgi:phage repressor protein C with HTH and peptisase S24 domain
MKPADIRRQNLKTWFANRSIPTAEKSYISQLMSATASFGEKAARRLEQTYEMGAGYLDRSPEENAKTIGLSIATDEMQNTGEIQYWNVRGSCGGGFLNFEQMPKGHLIKESTFFSKYGLKPENAFAIYADGDSMAEFIIDGDIVIFDKSKTTPISGQIFAIEHPDGLRIKVLRRSIDGSWTLESKNADKRRYPDEVIQPGHAELLKIHGQFVYRQGG